MAQSKPEYRVVLLGRTGSGKSTSGNTILGRDEFDAGDDFGSVTADCKLGVCVRNDTQIQVVDCPGLFDTNVDHEQTGSVLVKVIASMHPGPDAFLYVVQMGRYTPEEFGSYRRLKILFDDTVVKYIIVLFTRGESLLGLKGQDASTAVIERIGESGPPSLQTVVQECGQRVVVFDNTALDKESQVDYLVKQIQSLNTGNGGMPYNCPKYAYISHKVEEEVSKRVQSIQLEDVRGQRFLQDMERDREEAERQARLMEQELREVEAERMRKAVEEETRRITLQQEQDRNLAEQQRLFQQQQEQIARQLKEEETQRQRREAQRILDLRRAESERQEAIRRLEEQNRQAAILSQENVRRERERREREEQARLQLQRQIYDQQQRHERLQREMEESRRLAELERERLQRWANSRNTSSSDCAIL